MVTTSADVLKSDDCDWVLTFRWKRESRAHGQNRAPCSVVSVSRVETFPDDELSMSPLLAVNSSANRQNELAHR